MKYVFFGTPDFAVGVLEKMIEAKIPPVAVICNPDRPFGRKKIVTPPPVKILAQKHAIEIFQPEKLDTDAIRRLKQYDADVFVVVAYSKILKKDIIEIPRLGVIGVHPSLLPKYRGATPIQSVILAGEKETGATLFMIDEKIDHGSILAQEILPIENPTYKELEHQLARLSGKLLAETLPKFITGSITPKLQDESNATLTKKFETADAKIDPVILSEAKNLGGQAAIEIERKIRAFNPEPGAWTIINGKRTKLLEAEIVDGKLKLKTIQVAGGKVSPSTFSSANLRIE